MVNWNNYHNMDIQTAKYRVLLKRTIRAKGIVVNNELETNELESLAY